MSTNHAVPRLISAFISESTCGEACWCAREDACHCSCGGKNHGVLREGNGDSPARTAKIDGVRYELKAVGPNLYCEAEAINGAAGDCAVHKLGTQTYRYPWTETDKGAPARIKRARKDQLAKWPELKAYRERIEALQQAGECQAVWDEHWPQLLWGKTDSTPVAKAA